MGLNSIVSLFGLHQVLGTGEAQDTRWEPFCPAKHDMVLQAQQALMPVAHLHGVSSYSYNALDEDIILKPPLLNNSGWRVEDDNVPLLRRPASHKKIAQTPLLMVEKSRGMKLACDSRHQLR